MYFLILRNMLIHGAELEAYPNLKGFFAGTSCYSIFLPSRLCLPKITFLSRCTTWVSCLSPDSVRVIELYLPLFSFFFLLFRFFFFFNALYDHSYLAFSPQRRTGGPDQFALMQRGASDWAPRASDQAVMPALPVVVLLEGIIWVWWCDYNDSCLVSSWERYILEANNR